ncbi:hypothetical protein C8R45DRAFT_1102777 [Mycena sanguinolenta]|nr:hypothetical protein C8R45DRAFT_1102777 [Mycena sanguinolenta]
MSTHRGRPAKRVKRNISGLRNQPKQQSLPKQPDSLGNTSGNSSDGDYCDLDGLDLTELDCLAFLEVDSDHDDDDNEADWEEIAKTEFQESLFELLAKIEEDTRDAGDTDWIPSAEAYEAKRAAERRKPGGRPKEYIKGPDTAYKSLRTQQRYAQENKTQSNLNKFLGLSAQSSSNAQKEEEEQQNSEDEAPPAPPADTPLSTAPPSRAPSPPPQTIPRTRSASVLSESDDELSPPLIIVDNSDEEMEEDDPNDWDVVVDDIVDPDGEGSSSPPNLPAGPSAPGINIRSWHALRDKIKVELQKKNLPITKYNQLLILRNFATLRIKGFKRIAASLEIARQWHEGTGNYFARRRQEVDEQIPSHS